MRTGTGFAAVGAVALVAALGTTGSAQADRGSGSGSGGGSDRTVRMLDDCDPATFNVFVGPDTCVGDGDTEFLELIDQLLDEGEAGKWRNNPDDTHVDKGESVKVKNLGGEAHTFTRVQEPGGGGCVDELNEVLGLEPAAGAVCAVAMTQGIVPPGGSAAVPAADLHVGHNHFQCMIHPWMTTEIEVRGHRH